MSDKQTGKGINRDSIPRLWGKDTLGWGQSQGSCGQCVLEEVCLALPLGSAFSLLCDFFVPWFPHLHKGDNYSN
jgi:hypothetical protein